MARFDLYVLPGVAGYVMDAQADILSDIATRIVVPLTPRDISPKPEKWMNPVFEIDGSQFMLMPQQIASVPRTVLTASVGNLAEYGDQVTRAVDFVFQGY